MGSHISRFREDETFALRDSLSKETKKVEKHKKEKAELRKTIEQQQQTIKELAEALNEAADDITSNGICGDYTLAHELKCKYRALAAQHIEE